jgi:ribosomal protein S18 acetylase RimI-like enzyme
MIQSYDDRRHRDDVIALWQTVFRHDALHNAPELVIDRKLAAGDGLFFVDCREARVIGTILAGYDGHRGWLYSVAVDPQHRQARIATALVQHAEQALTALGCVKINLQIIGGNRQVTDFYRSLGYEVEDRISMGRRVPQNVTGAP